MTSFGEQKDSEDNSLTGTNQFSFSNWLELMLFIMKDRNFIFLAADNNQI